jgi:formylglycine-generating enzyme required for sulfatase activity
MILLCLALVCLAENPRVVLVKVEPRWKWNGLVDITCDTAGVAGNLLYTFQLKGYDKDRNQEVAMRTLSLDGGRSFATYADGKVDGRDGASIQRFTWDAAKDCPTLNTASFTVSVGVKVQAYIYLVVDLSTGRSRYANEAPDLSGDTCRTTELWLHWIPAGTFTMGSPEGELGRYSGEVQHEVTLTHGYWMGVFEVTHRQWELIMEGNPSDYKGEVRPVEKVSYNDIRGRDKGAGWPLGGHEVDSGSFLGKLRAKTGLAFDLPTEAQWEYACRAGTTTALNSGKNLTDVYECPNMMEVGRYNYNRSDGKGDCIEHTRVGIYLPNAWGLYDMHGNVWEWCLDWFGELTSPLADPKGASTGTNRVDRGGSWYSDAVRCASSYRGGEGYWPSNGRNNVGFRICLPLSCPSILAEGDLVEGVAIRLGGAPDGWTLHYTTDGSEPTAASPAYTGPFTLAESATVTRNVLCRQGFRVCRQGFGIPICRPD